MHSAFEMLFSKIMRWIRTHVFGGELIDVAPVHTAEAVHGHTERAFDRLQGARVFPAMKLCLAIGKGKHPTAAVPARGHVVKRLAIEIPSDFILAENNVVLMGVHEDTQFGANPACK